MRLENGRHWKPFGRFLEGRPKVPHFLVSTLRNLFSRADNFRIESWHDHTDQRESPAESDHIEEIVKPGGGLVERVAPGELGIITI